MKKVSRRQMQSIQKKALKEQRLLDRKSRKNSSVVSTENGLILCISSSMKDLLETDTFIYQSEQKHKYRRFPKIRRISHRVK